MPFGNRCGDNAGDEGEEKSVKDRWADILNSPENAPGSDHDDCGHVNHGIDVDINTLESETGAILGSNHVLADAEETALVAETKPEPW